jgi:hypothetical protein
MTELKTSVPKLARQLVSEYHLHAKALKAAVVLPDSVELDQYLVSGAEFDQILYRQAVSKALADLKACTVEMAQSGHHDCFAVLGIHSSELIASVCPIRRAEGLEIALDEMSKFFPVSSDFLLTLQRSPLRVKLPVMPVGLLNQAVSGHENPLEQLDRYLIQASDEQVLPLFLKGIETMPTLASRDDQLAAAKLFYRFQTFLKTRSNIPEAIDWFGANQGRLLPLIAELLPVLRTVNEAVTSTARERSLLSTFSFPPEFLCGLQDCCSHPVLSDLAQLALEKPQGYMAYTYLDSLGLAQTPAWHLEAQVAGEWSKLVKLHEYAMVTPGFELDLRQFDDFGGRFSTYAARLYVELLAETPAITADAKRKQAMIFDGLVKHCSDPDFGDKIRGYIINGNIPKELFKPHLKLLGDRFHQDLGL